VKPLSVVIIAKNEERNIGRCLASVSWADEIVMLDSGSEDQTADIAREQGVKVFVRPWKGYGAAKKEAVDRAAGDWILAIDADDR